MVTIYNTPLSTTSEKALFGRPGGGGGNGPRIIEGNGKLHGFVVIMIMPSSLPALRFPVAV